MNNPSIIWIRCSRYRYNYDYTNYHCANLPVKGYLIVSTFPLNYHDTLVNLIY